MNLFYKVIGIFSLITAVQAVHQPSYGQTAAAGSSSPIGYWRTEDGKAKVEIYACGEKTICGKIIALKEPNDPKTGKPKVDPKGKAMLGMEIIKNLKNTESAEWEDGKIYDPKEGETYSAQLTLEESGNVIKLRGYVLTPLFGRSQTWQRVTKEAPLS